MRNLTIATCLLATLALDITLAQAEGALNLIPVPKQIALRGGSTWLGETSRILVRDRRLLPLAKILSQNIYLQTGVALSTGYGARPNSGVVLGLDPDLQSEAYSWEEMKDIVRYADERGVTLIPEIDVPGHSRFLVGGRSIVGAQVPGREYVTTGTVKAGTYTLAIKHFYRITRNELNLWVKKPGAAGFEPYESLVLPMSQWVAPPDLNKLPPDCRFVDPVKLANTNLATDKPVEVSGGWQGNWVPANAVDGAIGNDSGWHADPYPQWLQVDLGQAYRVGRLKLYTFFDGSRYSSVYDRGVSGRQELESDCRYDQERQALDQGG